MSLHCSLLPCGCLEGHLACHGIKVRGDCQHANWECPTKWRQFVSQDQQIVEQIYTNGIVPDHQCTYFEWQREVQQGYCLAKVVIYHPALFESKIRKGWFQRVSVLFHTKIVVYIWVKTWLNDQRNTMMTPWPGCLYCLLDNSSI